MAQALLNSLIWANIPLVEAKIPMPSFKLDIDGISVKFGVGLLSGLADLVCTGAELTGTAKTGVTGKATLTAPELFSHGDVEVAGLATITAGLTLKQPKISVTISLHVTSSGELDIKATRIKLDSTGVSAKILGIEIPNWALSVLEGAVEEAVDGPLQPLLLAEVNKAIKALLKKSNTITNGSTQEAAS
jgi:hypothetical protein